MWPNAPETLELLDQARKGEAEAVEQLMARHREALRRLIDMRLDPAVRGRVDASDIVQEVFLEASRRLHDYLRDPRMPFHLWLRQLARDRLIDAYRQHRLAQRRSLDREQPLAPAAFNDRSSIELVAQLIDPNMTPASAAMRAELHRRLDAAMACLDDFDREIILMRHVEQLGNQEIAAALGLSEAAASMRYVRALRHLRTSLRPG